MLDYYDIKLPDIVDGYWESGFFRRDIPKREDARFHYLCELYEYEMIGCHPDYEFDDKISFLLDVLACTEEYYDISKYKRYLKHLKAL